MEQVEQLESQKRELLGILSATLWVLEHPDVNAIRFSGNPRELAQRIRLHLERGGMAFANSKPANARAKPGAVGDSA
jgi:hypothetical protein